MSKILKSFGMAALLVALLAGTGMGQADVMVTGQVDTICSITAPTDPATWMMSTIGLNEVDAGDLTVSCNYDCDVKVAEAEVGDNAANGFMEDTTDGSKVLTNELQIDATGASAGTAVTTPFDITGTAAKLWESDGALSGATVPLNLDQTLAYGDVADTYDITLVFTAAPTGT
jgi:hypothetical protein